MKYLKLFVFVLAVLISKNGYSAFKVCGQKTSSSGYVSQSCHCFAGGCNDEKNLAAFGWYYPGGWTCKDLGIVVGDDGNNQLSRSKGSSVGNNANVHLIRSKDGSAYVRVDGEKAHIRSDAHEEFMEKIEQETAHGRVNIEAIRSQIDAFLETDSGYVSDARLKEYSKELGVPIESEDSLNPRVESAAVRGSATADYNATLVETKTVQIDNSAASGSRRADECSLPDCSCRVISASGASLCEGGTEGQTAAGVHFCNCGNFGQSAVQTGGTGGNFTAGDGVPRQR